MIFEILVYFLLLNITGAIVTSYYVIRIEKKEFRDDRSTSQRDL